MKMSQMNWFMTTGHKLFWVTNQLGVQLLELENQLPICLESKFMDFTKSITHLKEQLFL